MICCRIITRTLSLNMNGHQKTFGKRSTPVSFLTHQMNHSRKGNRLVINFGKRKSSIIFPEFGYFLGKKMKKKTFRLKTYGFSSAFQEVTYYKLKLREQEICLYHSGFRPVFFSSRDFIKTESNQNSEVEYKSY